MELVQVAIGLAATMIGVLAGHLLAVRSQRLAWAREDQQGQLTRQLAQKMEFTVEVRFVAPLRDLWLVELICRLDNKGTVRYDTRELTFDLRCLHPEDPLVTGAQIGGQTVFPHLLIEGSWLPPDWEGTFIEPGLSTRYGFVTTVPAGAVAVLLHGLFRSETTDGTIVHTAEALHEVPPAGIPMAGKARSATQAG